MVMAKTVKVVATSEGVGEEGPRRKKLAKGAKGETRNLGTGRALIVVTRSSHVMPNVGCVKHHGRRDQATGVVERAGTSSSRRMSSVGYDT